MSIELIRKNLGKYTTIIIVLVLVFFYGGEILLTSNSNGVEEIKESESIVVKVYDGDTFTLKSGEKVRLIGIDAPEIGEIHATSSRDFLESLIFGKEVTLEKDISEKDKYNRLLRYVYVEDIFVNEVVLESGFAKERAYYPDTANESLFEQAEIKAKEKSVGIWSD